MPYIICSQDSHQVYCDIKPLCLEPALVAIFQHPLHDMGTVSVYANLIRYD